MRHLTSRGIMRCLDHATAYHLDHTRTLTGRGALVSTMIPNDAAACMTLAAWIWIGGDFPPTIDLLTDMHFRSRIHGRRVRVFNRKAPASQKIMITGREVTSPARTACDITLLPDLEFEDFGGTARVRELMEHYDVGVDDCLRILDDNRYWPNRVASRRRLESLGGASVSVIV